ncbi:GNAT family N-acetyltransferase [Candidatus Woesearchaeota archaeon]|nr:GNAT family N-acetyltransferase [Candidatus Woesearchaeota archaeon]
MKLSLIKTKKSEIRTIAKIYMTEFSKPPYNESWTINKSLKKISFFYQFYDLYSIKADQELVGFICINPNFLCPGDIAFGEEIAIKEGYTDKGIGTWVLNEISKTYSKKGFKKLMGIVDTNSRAKKLYKRLGINPSKKNILIEKDIRRT